LTRTGFEQPILRLVMADEADRVAAAQVPGDLWRRGRRRHRRRVGGAVVAVLTVALAIPGLVVSAAKPPPPVTGAPADGSVPGRVFDPYLSQAPVAESPTGRAAVLLSGSGDGLGTQDLPWTFGSKIASVGRDGSYRMLRYGRMYAQAGQDVQLSPDGRYVVGPDSFEEYCYYCDGQARLSVVDLQTGQARHFKDLPANVPVAWQPDGAALLLWSQPELVSDISGAPYDGNEAKYGYAGGSLWLLDLATGRSRKLLDLGMARFEPVTSAAFAPDGRHVAVQLDRTLLLVNTADGSSRTLASLGERQRLAGTGAFTADGTRIAVLDHDGCAVACTNLARNVRKWRVLTLDATTGQPASDSGFDRVPGAVVRMAGWQRNGTAVVVAYLDESNPNYDRGPSQDVPTSYRAVSAANLLALSPGGGTVQLIRPESVQLWDIDVAHDLLVEGRFGGPSPQPTPFPAASWLYWVLVTPLAVLLLIIAVVVVVWRRTRRPLPTLGPWGGSTSGPSASEEG
jgi:hypothetical protein